MMTNAIAPLMIDIAGLTLTPADCHRLQQPLVGGVILFARNYQHKKQLKALIKHIRSLKDNVLIAVDQEGGRVQRFQAEFSRLPPMARLGKLYDQNRAEALQTAVAIGVVLSYELAEVGIDFSFTPVLDVDYGHSGVIGDRAFHQKHQVIIELAQALVSGMHKVGMKVVGKHFPGHGFSALDSHIVEPFDDRTIDVLAKDYDIFAQVPVDAIMPAHIIYPSVDDKPGCFSPIWLNDILRQQLKFTGCVFSDDLSMQGAAFFQNMVSRVEHALGAGCDMAIICNNTNAIDEVLSAKLDYAPSVSLVTMKYQHQQISKTYISQAYECLNQWV